MHAGVCNDEDLVINFPNEPFFDVQGVRCDITITVTPQADGSIQVVENTNEVTNGVDGSSLDFTVLSLTGIDDAAATTFCCPAPDLRDGDDTTALATKNAWADNSGHPGFFDDDAALVPNFDVATNGVTVGTAGNVTLDPCMLSTWACDSGRGADERTLWAFGDGVVTDALSGTPGAQTHQYPTTDGTDQFLGVLVRLGPHCETTEAGSPAIGSDCRVMTKTYFRVNL